jgi:CBS domain-containing protein
MVHEVMRPLGDIVTAAPVEPVLGLLPRLQASPVRRALILDEGRLVGILTIADVTRALARPGTPGPDGPHHGPPAPPKET